MVTLKR